MRSRTGRVCSASSVARHACVEQLRSWCHVVGSSLRTRVQDPATTDCEGSITASPLTYSDNARVSGKVLLQRVPGEGGAPGGVCLLEVCLSSW